LLKQSAEMFSDTAKHCCNCCKTRRCFKTTISA